MTATIAPARPILVVEDDPILREFLERFLGREGYAVTGVATGEQALEQLDRASFDLVLVDLMLPGMNGGEVAWGARERGFESPIVAISAAMYLWDEADLKDLGVTEAIAKPYQNDELLALVKRLCPRAKPRPRSPSSPALKAPEGSPWLAGEAQ